MAKEIKITETPNYNDFKEGQLVQEGRYEVSAIVPSAHKVGWWVIYGKPAILNRLDDPNVPVGSPNPVYYEGGIKVVHPDNLTKVGEYAKLLALPCGDTWLLGSDFVAVIHIGTLSYFSEYTQMTIYQKDYGKIKELVAHLKLYRYTYQSMAPLDVVLDDIGIKYAVFPPMPARNKSWECIVCGGRVIRRCKCPRGDSLCENGHEYHYDSSTQEYHEGVSDHNNHEKGGCCKEHKVIIPRKDEVDEISGGQQAATTGGDKQS